MSTSMRRSLTALIVWLLFLVVMFLLSGCTTEKTYTEEEMELAKEEAYERGYENGRYDGRDEAAEEIESYVISCMEDLCLSDVLDYVNDIEYCLDAPEDAEAGEIEADLEGVERIVRDAIDLLQNWRESGIY